MAGVLRNVLKASSRKGIYLLRCIYQANAVEQSPLVVPMTKALVLKSRMRRKSHVRFGSGGEGGDSLTDHNLGRHE